jgi:serine/threonine protein kinase
MNSLRNQGFGHHPGKRNLIKFLMKDNNEDIDAKYKIHNYIGMGAFGVVFSATDKKTKKRVAIKKVNFWHQIYNYLRLDKSFETIFPIQRRF